MDQNELIQRLQRLKETAAEFKPKGVNFRDDPVFRKWRSDIVRFLKLGAAHTTQELKDVEGLWFRSHAMSMGGGYTLNDQQDYIEDLDAAIIALDAAIENITLGLTPNVIAARASGETKPKHSVVVHTAETVITGDQNSININSITVRDFILSLEKEIDKQVKDPDAKEGLRAQITALAKHPAFSPIMTLGLKSVLDL